MDINTYQRESRRYARYPGQKSLTGLAYATLGLNGEAGEIAEKVKKLFRDDNGELTEERRLALAKEAGDVLWYLAAVTDELGFTLSDIASSNLVKLEDRAGRNVLTGDGDER